MNRNSLWVVVGLVCLSAVVDSSLYDFFDASSTQDYNDQDYADEYPYNFRSQESTEPTVFRAEDTTTEEVLSETTTVSSPSTIPPRTSGDRDFGVIRGGPADEDTSKNTSWNLLFGTKELTWALDNLASVVGQQQVRMAELEKTNKQLQEKVDMIEEQTKTNNLIFFNVREDDRETYKTTLTKVLYTLNKIMKVKTSAVEIAVALRTDSEDGATPRPIVVRFANFATRMRVLAARKSLHRSGVVVEPDYSEGVVRVRALLLPYMQAARAVGSNAFLVYDRLVIDGVKFSLQEVLEQDQQAGTVGSGYTVGWNGHVRM